MIDEAAQRIQAVVMRFNQFEIQTSEPKWSSLMLDRLLQEVIAVPGGSLQDVYQGLDNALKTYPVQLTETVGHLIKDLVVQGFTQYRSAYDSIRWDWANEELSHGCLAARCYLFLLALPPDSAKPESIVAINNGLQGTLYHQQASDMLSDELDKPEIRNLLTPA